MFNLKIEKPRKWSDAYYSIPTYILILLLIIVITAGLEYLISEHIRSVNGLPPLVSDPRDTIGYSIVASAIFYINIAYSLVILVIRFNIKHELGRKILFNSGLILAAISYITLLYLGVDLAVKAP